MSERTVEEVAHVESMMAKARIAERRRCINVIADQQRQYDGGSAASVALGLVAVALNRTP